MPLFEFDGGRLVPAQFGHTVTSGLTSDLVDAICSQVFEIVARPLFPITWRELSRLPVEGDSPRLTALDVSGQVVSVEVVAKLDSDTLIASLSRLADAAALSWADLAHEYEGGVEAFKNGWLEFRDSMPPASGAGPRLVMVVGAIDPQVRPALDVLASSGVEVHEISLRRMSNGRVFLEVNAVGPRMYGHAPQLPAGQSTIAAVLPPPPHDEDEVHLDSEVHLESEDGAHTGRLRLEGVLPEEEFTEVPIEESGANMSGETPQPDASAVPGVEHASHGATRNAPAQEAAEFRAARQNGVPLLNRDSDGLKVLATLIGESVPLSAHEDCAAPDDLILDSEGRICSQLGTWASPEELEALFPRLADAWDHLRVAGSSGPTLGESIDEVNREMIREYSRTSGRSRGRHASKA